MFIWQSAVYAVFSSELLRGLLMAVAPLCRCFVITESNESRMGLGMFQFQICEEAARNQVPLPEQQQV